MAGRRGGQHGDLYIVIKVMPDSVFTRNGNDLQATLSVSFIIAALGGEVSLTRFGAEIKINVPPGTQSDTILKTSDSGMPVPDTNNYGDLHTKVRITVPESLTKEQRDHLREFINL
jgi:molecular chaperone DnaJ